MRNLLKKATVVFIACVMCFSVISGAACVKKASYDETKTQLFVANYAGGVGRAWLDDVAERYEVYAADWQGEGDKVGVEVIIDNQKEYEGQPLASTIRSYDYEIFFTSNAQYRDFATGGLTRDVTNVVTKVGSDGKSIESKMYQEDIDAMKIDGKYYGIPHYEYDDGVSYDAGVFESKKLYFSDIIDEADETYPGTRRFVVNEKSEKSPGPDGVTDTYDDGLPSSYQEFYKLLDKMLKNDVKAFVWSGQLVHYTSILAVGLSNNYLGAKGLSTCFDFDSDGETVEIVTGFDANNKPIVEDTVITEDNAYLLKQSLANYYAIEFCTKIFKIGSGLYDEDCTSGTVSHLRAMELFANSGLDGDMYDAMLIEGTYWHNEGTSDGIFTRLAEDYPATYTKKKIKYMPLPRQYEGTVTEGNGTAPVFSGAGAGYCFVNATVEEKQVPLIEDFLAFCYTDENLVKFTEKTNGITRRLKYDYMSAYNNINSFGQSLLDVRDAAAKGGGYVVPFSNHRAFLRNTKLFGRNNTSGYWDSTISGQKYAYVYTAARNNKSAQDYFNGMKMTATDWQGYLN